MSLRRLVYISTARNPLGQRELLDLLHDARGFNTVDGITGLLLYRDGRFLQVLEGESDAIDDLLLRLHRDTRHHSLHVVDDRAVEVRLFGAWSMECAELDDPAMATLPGVSTDLADSAAVEALLDELPAIADWLTRFRSS